jgi:UDP-N-acetylmuramate dehydrogenase
MAAHTTFHVGGPADVWLQPDAVCFPAYTAALRAAAKSAGVPVFVLGCGANLVVSDAGIRGIVLDTGRWNGVRVEPAPRAEADTAATGAQRLIAASRAEADAAAAGAQCLIACAGAEADAAASMAAELGVGTLAFLAGMPGSIGGAVWMNARCYNRSVSDTLLEVEIIDEAFRRVRVPFAPEAYGYKQSPFQQRPVLILSAAFRVEQRPVAQIRREMDAHRHDRESKGHYRFASAGSVFKNDRAFGKPTGQIIDELGLRGLRIGGAHVAPWHGNIIINTGQASAADIRALVDELVAQVHAKLGIRLEPEVLFIGAW